MSVCKNVQWSYLLNTLSALQLPKDILYRARFTFSTMLKYSARFMTPIHADGK